MRCSLRHALAVAVLCCLSVPVVRAGETGSVKKVLKGKTGQTFYLRTNLPYIEKSQRQQGPAADAPKEILVSVETETGVTIAEAPDFKATTFTVKARRLSLRVNDSVRIYSYKFRESDGTVDIELEGTQARSHEGIVQFGKVATLQDFEKCWDRVFSNVPLETTYDWPRDIKEAVSARIVQKGMTRDQVLVALGNPEKVTRSTSEGTEIETWTVWRGPGVLPDPYPAPFGALSTRKDVDDREEWAVTFADGKVIKLGPYGPT